MSEAAVVETDATAQHDAHAVFRGAVRKAKLPGGQDVWVIAGYDEVAALLHVHPQTVRYRMNQVRDAFGDDLDDPARAVEILLAARAAGCWRRG